MISLLLAATLLCPITVPDGRHSIDITAKYLHTVPDGTQYVYQKIQRIWGPVTGHVVAEGHPWYVEASINGVTIGECFGQGVVFIDGFESGDTGAWSYAAE